MEVNFAPADSIVGRIKNALHANENLHPLFVDMTSDEYDELLKESGAPTGAVIQAVIGIQIFVEGRPAEQHSSGIVIAQ